MKVKKNIYSSCTLIPSHFSFPLPLSHLCHLPYHTQHSSHCRCSASVFISLSPSSVLPFTFNFLSKSYSFVLSLSHFYFLLSFISYYVFLATSFVSVIAIHVFVTQQQQQQKIFFFLYPRDAATFGRLDFQ